MIIIVVIVRCHCRIQILHGGSVYICITNAYIYTCVHMVLSQGTSSDNSLIYNIYLISINGYLYMNYVYLHSTVS